nr:MBL fold metallo-hydrolase [Planococcus salinarum]
MPIAEFDWNKIGEKGDSLTWLGHSAFILSLDNNKILIDPMLAPRLPLFPLSDRNATVRI